MGTRNFYMFGRKIDKDDGINDRGEHVTVERMHGCNGTLHVDSLHRLYSKDGEVVFADELWCERIGECDNSCKATLGQFKGSGFVYELAD